jgi:hypothetical protein
MGVSETQTRRVEVVCACGCGKTFYPFPIYKSKRVQESIDSYTRVAGKKGAPLYIPKYIRGHHPNCQKNHAGNKPPWNKGLKKEDHPSIPKMGFQPGHPPYNDWSHVTEKQRYDEEYRARWLEAKRGQIPWNKGKTKDQYENGIKSGPNHGNWCGGRNDARDTAEYRDMCKKILKRDNYTCQQCGDRNYKGRGSRICLEVHHIVAYSEDPSLSNDPNNLITLCSRCHRQTDNYGTKLIQFRKKQGGKQSTEFRDR